MSRDTIQQRLCRWREQPNVHGRMTAAHLPALCGAGLHRKKAVTMSDFKGLNVHFETLQLHAGQENPDPATDARAVPIYQTASYVFHSSAHAADRFGLVGCRETSTAADRTHAGCVEQRVAALEGGACRLRLLRCSGSYCLCVRGAGAGWPAYRFLQDHLRRHIQSAGSYAAAFGRNGHICGYWRPVGRGGRHPGGMCPATCRDFGKTPVSDVADVEMLAAIAHRHGIPLVVDSTFATPYLLRPIEYGADVVVHSATKFIGGHGTSLGGVIVEGGGFDPAAAGRFPALSAPNPSYHGVSFTQAAGPAALVTYIRAVLLRDTGAAISPFNAFLLLQGLETLSLRVERHVENALRVVDFLVSHPKVERVNHPSLPENGYRPLYEKYFPRGGGSIFTFEIKGGAAEAQAFIDKLRIFSLLANVADVKSLAIHPASTTHSQMTPEGSWPKAASGQIPSACPLARNTSMTFWRTLPRRWRFLPEAALCRGGLQRNTQSGGPGPPLCRGHSPRKGERNGTGNGRAACRCGYERGCGQLCCGAAAGTGGLGLYGCDAAPVCGCGCCAGRRAHLLLAGGCGGRARRGTTAGHPALHL